MGHPPAADGSVTVIAPGSGHLNAVLAFTSHHVVVADIDPDWVHERLPDGDMSTPMSPSFLGALGTEIGRTYDNLDLVLVARGEEGPPGIDLVEMPPDENHPRVARAMRYRTEVHTHVTPGGDGILIIARGLGGRWEVAFEVDPDVRGRGMGRALAAAARRLVPAGAPVFLQVSPGNVSSLRAVLATGLYRPFGAEAIFPT